MWRRGAARREAEEELGVALVGMLQPLGTIRQAGGKIVEAFALEQEVDPPKVSSNDFELEWLPGSGLVRSFPEVDAARWMTLAEARTAMLPSQRPLLDRLRERVGSELRWPVGSGLPRSPDLTLCGRPINFPEGSAPPPIGR